MLYTPKTKHIDSADGWADYVGDTQDKGQIGNLIL